MKYLATVEGKSFEIEILDSGEVLFNGERYALDLHSIDGMNLYSLLLGNISYDVMVEEESTRYQVLVQGELFTAEVRDARNDGLLGTSASPLILSGEVEISAPIPGVVVHVPVQPGEPVRTGQVLVVLESMKMENELKSPCDGLVKALYVSRSDAVNQGQILVVVEAGG